MPSLLVLIADDNYRAITICRRHRLRYDDNKNETSCCFHHKTIKILRNAIRRKTKFDRGILTTVVRILSASYTRKPSKMYLKKKHQPILMKFRNVSSNERNEAPENRHAGTRIGLNNSNKVFNIDRQWAACSDGAFFHFLINSPQWSWFIWSESIWRTSRASVIRSKPSQHHFHLTMHARDSKEKRQ